MNTYKVMKLTNVMIMSTLFIAHFFSGQNSTHILKKIKIFNFSDRGIPVRIPTETLEEFC